MRFQLDAPSQPRGLLREPARPAAIRESPRAHWYVVATVCIGAFMGQLDASIVTLALPRMGSALHAGIASVQWISLSYLLVLACSVIGVGHLADRVGRKLFYVYGFGAFTLGSLACALAPSLGWLIAARASQGLGAAMLQANSVALITQALPRRALGRGIGIQGAAQATGLALGPLVGGALLALGGWRLIFLINLPAGLLGGALGWVLLPRSRDLREGERFDLAGNVLLGLCVATLILVLSVGGRIGYLSPATGALVLLGLASTVAFWRRELMAREPLIDPELMRDARLVINLICGLGCYTVTFGVLMAVPFYLQASHVGPALAGLELAAFPVALGFTAPLASVLSERLGARRLSAGGLLLATVGLVEMALRHQEAGLIVGLAIAGGGLGFFTPLNNAAIMSRAPRLRTGLIGGTLNMTRALGMTLGVACVSSIYGMVPHADPARALDVSLVFLAAAAIVTAALGLLYRPR
jgi:EmrB/QacA subfamily drug resistance transporter